MWLETDKTSYKSDHSSPELSLLLGCISDLYNWEMENLPFMQTTTGRFIYHALAGQVLSKGSSFEMPLKPLFLTQHFTEKALRIRIQEMAEQGLVETVRSKGDNRTKCLVPTEKFQELVHAHAQIAQNCLRNKFLVIPK